MRISHVAWNLGGLATPLAVAVVTVPHLIEVLGKERFGLLALAWGLVGYAGALDLGIGRALTQMVGQMRGDQEFIAIPTALATAGRITLIAGTFGALILGALALTGGPALVHTQTVPTPEIASAMLLLAIALPAQAMCATYRGLNEAFLNFKGISLLRSALGIVNFAGPYAVSLFTTDLTWLVATLAVSRVLALFMYRYLAQKCLREEERAQGPAVYSRKLARSLFSFGGWVTVSSVISPMLVQADRFVIAGTISAAAVAVYVVPYEVVAQSLIVVGAVSSVMFPGLSQLIRERPNDWQPYFKKWFVRVVGLMAVVCTTTAALLPTILPLWVKGNLPPESIVVGQILTLGVFANSIGSMFYALLHAKGRASVTAKIHLVEFPVFIVVLIYLVQYFGVLGAAWAWVGRMAIDAALLARAASRSVAN